MKVLTRITPDEREPEDHIGEDLAPPDWAVWTAADPREQCSFPGPPTGPPCPFPDVSGRLKSPLTPVVREAPDRPGTAIFSRVLYRTELSRRHPRSYRLGDPEDGAPRPPPEPSVPPDISTSRPTLPASVEASSARSGCGGPRRAREDRLGDQSRVIEHRYVPDVIEHDEVRSRKQLART